MKDGEDRSIKSFTEICFIYSSIHNLDIFRTVNDFFLSLSCYQGLFTAPI